MPRTIWSDDNPGSPPSPALKPSHALTTEYEASLQDAALFDLLLRKDDLLDEGVSTVFGIRRGEAEPQAFRFCARRFTPEQAGHWLRERGWTYFGFQPAGD